MDPRPKFGLVSTDPSSQTTSQLTALFSALIDDLQPHSTALCSFVGLAFGRPTISPFRPRFRKKKEKNHPSPEKKRSFSQKETSSDGEWLEQFVGGEVVAEVEISLATRNANSGAGQGRRRPHPVTVRPTLFACTPLTRLRHFLRSRGKGFNVQTYWRVWLC